MSEEETKYKSLIQPIKDLAQNWDIDIAESLTDYLDELAGLTITLDGGHINLNFAEAALVIQGSTAVYSKKVEYLHQLVLQSLEFISNKKSNVISTNKVKSSNINQYDDESFLFGNDPDGLLLDHTLDNGLDLYLKNESAADLQMKKRHSLGRSSMGSRSSAAGVDVSRISISLMHSILNDDQRSAGLKLSSCLMDSSGALLIGGVQSSVADMEVYGSSSNNSSRVHNQSSSLLLSHSKGLQPHREVMFHDGTIDGVDGGDDDYDYDAGAMQMDHGEAGTEHTPSKNASGQPPPLAEEEEHLTTRERDIRALAALMGDPLEDSDIRDDSRPFMTRKVTKPPELLRAERKTARAKKAAEQQPLTAKEEKQAAKDAEAEVAALAARFDCLLVDKVENFAAYRRLRSYATTGAVPMRGLYDLSLMGVLRRKRKAARKQAREAKRLEKVSEAGKKSVSFMQQGSGSGSDRADISGHFEEMWSRDYDGPERAGDLAVGDEWLDGGAPSSSNHHQLPEDRFAQDDQGGGEGGYDDFHDDNNDDYGGGNDDDEEQDEEQRERDELARRLEDVLNEDMHGSQSMNSQGLRPNSYEAICRRHIENFMSGAEQYARETQLSRRVSEWTARLEPLLREQEESVQFDIHEYSDRLLIDLGEVVARTDRLSLGGSSLGDPEEEQDVVSFRDVAEGRPSAEVCRVFLACLQLANLGNVEVLAAMEQTDSASQPEVEADVVGVNGKRASASQSRAAGPKKRGKTAVQTVDDQSGSHSSSLVSGSMDPRQLFRLRLLRDLRHRSIEAFSTQ